MVYWEPQGNNVIMDLVKIMLFMQPRAHDVYVESDLHDPFAAQPNTHSHPLSAGCLPTPTGTMRASIPTGLKICHMLKCGSGRTCVIHR